MERHLDGGDHELRGFRVDDDVPGLLHPAAAACFPGPAAGAGWDAWQAGRYQRGEISQRPGYTGNPFGLR